MINLLGNSLTLAGVWMLVASLFRITRLTRELTATLRQWYFLEGLILFFIFGYAGYTVLFWSHRDEWHDLIIPAIFFFGAVFVWLVSALALQTVNDLRRVELLEHQTITDALTGLYNRRYLDRRIADEFVRARRYDHPLSLLMLDIDHFKQLNDSHGHQAGDLALGFISRLLLDGVREPDFVARYGGEEIVIIAPSTGLRAAGELAERLRRRIESHELKLASADRNSRTLHLTVSIGVAALTPSMDAADELLCCADAAMYRAKQRGRNRVVLHRDPE